MVTELDRRTFLRTIGAGLGAAAAFGTGVPAFAGDAVSEALAEVTKARASLKNLVAKFSQDRTVSLLATTVTSTGEMTLVRPDKLRWELKPPDAITYWITPDGLAFSTPNGSASVGKAGAQKFGAILGDLLVLLGGDLEKLRERYEITIPSRKDGITIVAKPKAEDVKKKVTQIEMVAGPELWTVQKVTIEEKSGDKSVITFSDVAKDATVDAAKMTPPKP